MHTHQEVFFNMMRYKEILFSYFYYKILHTCFVHRHHLSQIIRCRFKVGILIDRYIK